MSAEGSPEPTRTRVKVCGLTNRGDAAFAIEHGADWLGFIVHGDSPRRIDARQVAAILATLPRVEAVAVMVAPSPAQALELASLAGASRIQLHGIDSSAWPADFPVPLHVSVGVDERGALTAPLPPDTHLLHLDTSRGGREGGTGQPFPWSIASDLARTRSLVLAGGLGPDNVAEALRIVRPFAVDASSRLEASPGIKDPERVRRFLDAVREHDAQDA